MKVLVIGNGGREHALVWKIGQSSLVNKIYCAPGNAGIAKQAKCLDIAADDFDKLLHFAGKEKIDLTVVGPEAPLAAGIVDRFEAQGLKIFGPSKNAAELESSKVFAKYIMGKYSIPCAKSEVADDPQLALKIASNTGFPCVIKADGLAAGKGVIICDTIEDAESAIDRIMIKREFGESGRKVLIEEFLQGEEASVFAISDGQNYKILVSSQDHKSIFDGDQGPNTGGMGAYAPAPVVTDELMQKIEKQIIEPTITGMALEEHPYRGLLYAGIMITPEGPKVLEFNCRFGDPETQVVLPVMKTDLVDLLLAACEGRLEKTACENHDLSAVCVVMASGGYPGSYQKGIEILGLDRIFPENTFVFHAGTRMEKNHAVTSGGRVLGVTAWAPELTDALKTSYDTVGKITFNGAYYRRDIAHRALNRI
ncbi:phosphoribosylamine--glycine ligase [candidate division KSB1 bacterium]|nr:phosphoribosylamine--glycine ligase [candidate division KSB1 bacterium]